MGIKPCGNIFEELREDTLIVIPVEGSFEYRIRDDYFTQGINPSSLHGQLITKLGIDSFINKVNEALKKEGTKDTEEKEFSDAIRNYYPIGTCITITNDRVHY